MFYFAILFNSMITIRPDIKDTKNCNWPKLGDSWNYANGDQQEQEFSVENGKQRTLVI